MFKVKELPYYLTQFLTILLNLPLPSDPAELREDPVVPREDPADPLEMAQGHGQRGTTTELKGAQYL